MVKVFIVCGEPVSTGRVKELMAEGLGCRSIHAPDYCYETASETADLIQRLPNVRSPGPHLVVTRYGVDSLKTGQTSDNRFVWMTHDEAMIAANLRDPDDVSPGGSWSDYAGKSEPDKLAALWAHLSDDDAAIARSRMATAVVTLERLGYTWEGGELWRPPLGKVPDFTIPKPFKAYAVFDDIDGKIDGELSLYAEEFEYGNILPGFTVYEVDAVPKRAIPRDGDDA